MAENFFKAMVMIAWAGIAVTWTLHWVGSSIKKAVETAWDQRSQGNAPDLRIVSEKQVA